MPNVLTFSHCAAVSRIERCSNRSSGAFGGLPLVGGCCCMHRILAYLLNHRIILKTLDILKFMYHNKSISIDKETCMNKHWETNVQCQRVIAIDGSESDRWSFSGSTANTLIGRTLGRWVVARRSAQFWRWHRLQLESRTTKQKEILRTPK